ncbi:MAG: hypothetical protein U9P36_06185 [Thermodesulfobacteriota bacterium]|nr:hypothetical protein [Thermodesulfobacteriota bacterium]
MKAIVLDMGLQGKAVIHDLESSSLITKIFAADLFATEKSLTEADDYLAEKGYSKSKAIKLDASMEKGLAEKFSKRDIDVVI